MLRSSPVPVLPRDVADVFLSYSLLDPAGHDLFIKACRVAAPIMRKRQWKVKRLKEFYPDNASLLGLNVNRGQEVCIRLRSGKNQFLEFESILHTLLHELVHIIHGNHSAAFYDMLEELTKESESVIFKQAHNVSDLEGRYWGEGQRLGGGMGARPANSACAGGRRLGGSARTFGVSAKQAAARATLQRMQDKTCCGTEQQQQEEEEEDKVVFVDAIPARRISLATSSGAAATGKRAVIVIDLDESPSSANQPSSNVVVDLLEDEVWLCPRCTFENISQHLQCLACTSVKPTEE